MINALNHWFKCDYLQDVQIGLKNNIKTCRLIEY